MPNAILRLPAVQERVGLRRTSIYGLIRAGTFPQPIKISARASGWLSEDVDRWIAARVAQSRGESNEQAAA